MYSAGFTPQYSHYTEVERNRDAARYQWLLNSIKNKDIMLKAQALFHHYTSRREFEKKLDQLMKQFP